MFYYSILLWKSLHFCLCYWPDHLFQKYQMIKGPAALQKIINHSISNFRNQKECSMVDFDHIYRSWEVVFSEVERNSSYSAAKMDVGIYLQNDKRTSCAVMQSIHHTISNIMNRSKCSLVEHDHIYRTYTINLPQMNLLWFGFKWFYFGLKLEKLNKQ